MTKPRPKPRPALTRLIALVLLATVLFAGWYAMNAGAEWKLPF